MLNTFWLQQILDDSPLDPHDWKFPCWGSKPLHGPLTINHQLNRGLCVVGTNRYCISYPVSQTLIYRLLPRPGPCDVVDGFFPGPRGNKRMAFEHLQQTHLDFDHETRKETRKKHKQNQTNITLNLGKALKRSKKIYSACEHSDGCCLWWYSTGGDTPWKLLNECFEYQNQNSASQSHFVVLNQINTQQNKTKTERTNKKNTQKLHKTLPLGPKKWSLLAKPTPSLGFPGFPA